MSRQRCCVNTISDNFFFSILSLTDKNLLKQRQITVWDTDVMALIQTHVLRSLNFSPSWNNWLMKFSSDLCLRLSRSYVQFKSLYLMYYLNVLYWEISRIYSTTSKMFCLRAWVWPVWSKRSLLGVNGWSRTTEQQNVNNVIRTKKQKQNRTHSDRL